MAIFIGWWKLFVDGSRHPQRWENVGPRCKLVYPYELWVQGTINQSENYRLVICYIAIEAMAHRNSWFTVLKNGVDFPYQPPFSHGIPMVLPLNYTN
jgi:hypothetical protein